MRKSILIALALFACGHDGGGTKMDGPPGGGGDASGGIDAPRGDAASGDASIALGPACSGTTCMLGTQECCLAAVSVCKPAGTCPSQGFLCDGPEDCPGAVCCYPNANNGSRCQTNNCQQLACHGDGDCPS